MDRRAFVGGIVLGIVTAPWGGWAQPAAGRVPRIGLIRPGSPPDPNAEAFVQGLRDLGYVEGQSIAIEYRWAAGTPEQIPKFAEELVRLKVNVIVTTNLGEVARQVTRTIPLVSPTMNDPVGDGLVASLARPGGNVTGLVLVSPELSAKRLQLLKETVPKLSRVAVLHDGRRPPTVLQATEAAARALGMHLQMLEVRTRDDLDKALAAAKQAGAGAVSVLDSFLFIADRVRIVQAARKIRLPVMYQSRAFVDAGGFISYGPDIPDLFRRAATYVDKVLKGAKPGALPIEQPTKFELVVNKRTAKTLGLTIPPSIMIRADHVVE
jgi:putative ABC transport system substrate-binding protein